MNISRAMEWLSSAVTAAAVGFVLLTAWNIAGDVGRELAMIVSEDAR